MTTNPSSGGQYSKLVSKHPIMTNIITIIIDFVKLLFSSTLEWVLIWWISLHSCQILIPMLGTQLDLSHVGGQGLNPLAPFNTIASYPGFHPWYVRKHGKNSSRSQS